jgi:hypothetical protein
VDWLFGSILREKGLEQIQDGIRLKISLQKFSQCCRLQARLKKKKKKCKNFTILKIYNLSKTHNFQNSLKIWVFITETYIQRKSCYNLLKKPPKMESENPWFRIGKWLDAFANIYPIAKLKKVIHASWWLKVRIQMYHISANGIHLNTNCLSQINNFLLRIFFSLSINDFWMKHNIVHIW